MHVHDDESYLPSGTAEQIDDKLTSLAVIRAGQDYEEGRWLLAAFMGSTHRGLGFATFETYADKRFGYVGRTLQEKIRVAEALRDLSECRAALASGLRSWSAIREITRVATTEDETRWLAETEGMTVRQIERLVAGASSTGPSETRKIHLDVPPEVYALWLDATKQVRKDAGGKLDQAEAFGEILRRALGGTDESRSPYQVAVQRCPDCDRSSVVANGEEIEVPREVADMAMCDAQILPDSLDEDAKQNVPPKTRRAVLRRDKSRCVVPGCRNTLWVDIHHITHQSKGGDRDPDNLVTLCGAHHRLHHNDRLAISGTPSTGLHFAHGDGRPFGRARSGPEHDIYLALRGLDFGARYSSQLLDFARAHVGANETPQALLRAALRAHHAGEI
ncbi:MAG: HNH endonuclease [bacterium]|nr:HNH endonuclease [bacterium]